jgi:hypothetical protein
MSPFKGNRGVRPAPTDRERDIALAQRLLGGHEANALDPDKIEYLSSDTTPTEKEGRQALARRLLAIAAKNDGDAAILVGLAQLFDPEVKLDLDPTTQCYLAAQRTVDFKNISTGHPTRVRHFWIAWEVERLCPTGKRGEKAKAVKEVMKRHGIKNEETVYRIIRAQKLLTSAR